MMSICNNEVTKLNNSNEKQQSKPELPKSNCKISFIMLISFFVSLLMAIIELLPAAEKYEAGMGIFAFVANTIQGIPYHFALILVLTAVFPLAYCLFRDNGLDLFSCIADRNHLKGDIPLGILAGILSWALAFLVTHVIFKFPVYRPVLNAPWVLSFVALVLVSGFFKEIYFRGIANHLLKEHLGEWKSFILLDILFAVLDWPNLGMSFLYGLIWIVFYKKRNRILVPMIAHAVHNLLCISIGFFI